MSAPKPTPPQPRTLTFEEVCAGAERAHELVSQWPEWKRTLSPWNWPDGSESQGSTSEGHR